MNFLNDLFGNNEEEDNYSRLLSESDNTATGAMNQSDINRGANPGNKSSWVKGLDPAALAKLDRYSWGAQAGLGGVPVAAGYEAVKGLAPAFMPLLEKAADYGYGNPEWFKTDKTTSPASLGNIGSYIRGAMRNKNKGLLAMILGS